MEILLAIDGGGSRTRCLAAARDGRRLGEGASGPSNHLQVPRATAVRSLSEAIGTALDASGAGFRDVICISAGLAGVDFDGAGAAEARALFEELGFRRLAIHGDMVIAHHGALDGRPGVLALAGTGASFLGIAPGGERVKVGGWGPAYGDEGSANWIGRQVLQASAQAYDGRAPRTALLDAVSRTLHLATFRDSVARVYGAAMSPREVAALGKLADAAAEAGDAVASGILKRAGGELARGVVAAARRLRLPPEECRVSYQGAVLDSCRIVREEFLLALRRELPEAHVTPPLFEPVMGAYLLGCEELGWEAGEHSAVKNVSR